MSKQYSGIYRRKEDGLFSCRFTVGGKRYTVYGKTVKECREKEAERRSKIEEGIYKSGRDVPFRDYFQRWIVTKEGSVKETTIRNYRMLFNMLARVRIDDVGTMFGDIKISKAEPQNIRDLQSGLKATQHTRTVNDAISLVKCVYKSALDDHLITWNPAAGVKPLRRTEPPARETIHRALTLDETKRFLDNAKGSWYYELYVFLINTGCRIGEAAAISQKDVSGKTVHIGKTITRTAGGGYVIGEETKTKSGVRTIPLNPAVIDAIAGQRYKNTATVIDMQETLFKAPRGGLVKPSLVNDDIKRICEKAGIDRFSVHAFRDTFATRCVESGMQPKTLQELMGHSDINMTMTLYAHVMDETKESQYSAVNFY